MRAVADAIRQAEAEARREALENAAKAAERVTHPVDPQEIAKTIRAMIEHDQRNQQVGKPRTDARWNTGVTALFAESLAW